jgi:hypothetical protein
VSVVHLILFHFHYGKRFLHYRFWFSRTREIEKSNTHVPRLKHVKLYDVFFVDNGHALRRTWQFAFSCVRGGIVLYSRTLSSPN